MKHCVLLQVLTKYFHLKVKWFQCLKVRWSPATFFERLQSYVILSSIMLKDDQTYFKNLMVFTPLDFWSISDHFSTLCMKSLMGTGVGGLVVHVRKLTHQVRIEKKTKYSINVSNVWLIKSKVSVLKHSLHWNCFPENP